MFFVLWPQLDLWLAGQFYRNGFIWAKHPTLLGLYHAAPWYVALYLVGTLSLYHIRTPGGVRQGWRYAAQVVGLYVAVPGILVNWILKEFWGRARPDTLIFFDGALPYSRAWEISSACPTNCSFVSGHAAAGFGLCLLAYLFRGQSRLFWSVWTTGLASGYLFGLARVAQGRHFLSDIVICGALITAAGAVFHATQRRKNQLPSLTP